MESTEANSLTMDIETMSGEEETTKDPIDNVTVQESSSEAEEEQEHEPDGPILTEVLAIAEAQERLRVAFHHYNQYRRLDIKIVVNYAYQFYQLVTCIVWLTIPTVASLVSSYIFDVLVKDKVAMSYKNYGLATITCMIWVYGSWQICSKWSDLKKSTNSLACLVGKTWNYQDRYLEQLLEDEPIIMRAAEDQVEAPKTDEPGIIEEIVDGQEHQKAKSVDEMTIGATGDTVRVTEKDKEV